MNATTHGSETLLLFRLGAQRYALRLAAVDRVIRAVAVTPVPETPAYVLGLINLGGQLVPVCSLRRCVGLADQPIRAADEFVIVHTARQPLALVVDEVQGLRHGHRRPNRRRGSDAATR